MMKKRKIAAATLTGVLAFGTVFAPVTKVQAVAKAEYDKNENVYVRMDSEGDVSGTYVVNAFTVKEAGEITDYGDYDSILNLTNLDEIEEDKEEYTFYAEEGKFYYQGNIENAKLPWEFEISYLLDEKEVTADELAGAEGDLEIHIGIKENTAVENPAFYQAYLLQVGVTLDNELCKDITAEGASIADAGSNQKITFNVTPDMLAQAAKAEDKEEKKTGAELVVATSVTDFEMEDISINGAALKDFSESFISQENKNIGQTMFLMSAKGITIPDEKVVKTVEKKDNRNFIRKLIDKILHHKED